MASGTGLYDFDRQDWDEELLQFCGLTNSKLNPLADRCDRKNDCIFSAIGDGAASNLGSGATKPGFVAINVGTSAAVRAIAARDLAPSLGLFRFVVDRERALLGGAVSNAGNVRAWCVRELRPPPNDRAIEKLLRAPGGDSRLTILPFWVGERAPTWPENLDGIIMGLTQTTPAGDLLRGCSAAVGHRLALILEELEKIVGRAKQIIVSGGILQSPASLQILANSLGRDLVAAADQEASLRGAAIYAAQELGRKAAPPKFGLTIRHDRRAAADARAARQRQIELEARLLPNDRAL